MVCDGLRMRAALLPCGIGTLLASGLGPGRQCWPRQGKAPARGHVWQEYAVDRNIRPIAAGRYAALRTGSTAVGGRENSMRRSK
jgi:hypothetical protein